MVITEDEWHALNEQIGIIVLRLDRMHEHMVDNINRLEKKMDNGKVREMMEMETKPENAITHLQDSVECFDRLLKKSDIIIAKLDSTVKLVFARTEAEITEVVAAMPENERKKVVEEIITNLKQKFNV